MRRSPPASMLQALIAAPHADTLRIQLADSHSITAVKPVACAAKQAQALVAHLWSASAVCRGM